MGMVIVLAQENHSGKCDNTRQESFEVGVVVLGSAAVVRFKPCHGFPWRIEILPMFVVRLYLSVFVYFDGDECSVHSLYFADDVLLAITKTYLRSGDNRAAKFI